MSHCPFCKRSVPGHSQRCLHCGRKINQPPPRVPSAWERIDRQRADAEKRLADAEQQRERERRRRELSASERSDDEVRRALDSLRPGWLAQAHQLAKNPTPGSSDAVRAIEPAATTAAQSKVPPVLPIELTVASLESILLAHNYAVRNLRSTGGGFFVRVDAGFDLFAEQLKHRGIGIRHLFYASWPGAWVLIDRDHLLS